MDRFDICEAYAVLEWDYNREGWLQERPSNQRRLQSIGVQLARMQFRPAMGLCFEVLTEDGQEVYLTNVLRWKLPRDAEQNKRIAAFFAEDWLREHYPDVLAELHTMPAA